MSNWITHGVSLLMLILLNCSNSVLVRGVYIDAEEPAGQCVVFPVYYIRLFFQKERTKKQRKLLESLGRGEYNNITSVLLDKKPNKVEQNHQISRNLEAVPLTIIGNPKSNADHNTHDNRQWQRLWSETALIALLSEWEYKTVQSFIWATENKLQTCGGLLRTSMIG